MQLTIVIVLGLIGRLVCGHIATEFADEFSDEWDTGHDDADDADDNDDDDNYELTKGKVHYYCIDQSDGQQYEVDVDDPRLAGYFNVSQPLGVVVHGWGNWQFWWIKSAIEDWYRYGASNACWMDWSSLQYAFYPTDAMKTVPLAADHLTAFLWRVHNTTGIPFSRMQLAGHSLGAHVSGQTGKHIVLQADDQLDVIYGLDPAGPWFADAAPDVKLQPSDARFVQEISTNAGMYGMRVAERLADAEFVANGGWLQPWCFLPTTMICSHCRAYDYFQYSLNPANRFVGHNDNGTDLFGIHSARRHGHFELETSGWKPYAKG